MILVVLHSLLHMVILNVVLVLGSPTFTPINIIVGLMVVILYDIRVEIIQPRVVHTTEGTTI